MIKVLQKYFSKHVAYSAVVHFLGGMGVGMLLLSPVFYMHSIRWGLTFLALGILGHIYPLIRK